jgi:Histidine kinase
MHPILAHRDRLLLYFAAWIAYGSLFASVIFTTGQASGVWALAFTVPLAVLLGLQSLFCWYLVRVLPAGEIPTLRLFLSWTGVCAGSIVIWVAFGYGWSEFLRALPFHVLAPVGPPSAELIPFLGFAGAIGLAVCVLGHYLADAFARSRQAKHQALELEVLARESELRSLRAQLDPHFLFNSLNSIAALIGSDPPAARRMCFLMADFFRSSLALGGRASITLAEEMRLAQTFLAIESIRFGERLRTSFDVAEDTLEISVPPLVLQPLVENAVHHGVAHLIEGGEVKVQARKQQNLVELVVENACDPERPASRGTGVGLANVKSRIETLFGKRGSVTVESRPERFRVSVLLPCAP